MNTPYYKISPEIYYSINDCIHALLICSTYYCILVANTLQMLDV